MSISLTEKAAKRAKRYLDSRGKGVGLKFGVKTTGCSGMAYILEFVDEVSPEDQVFESHGLHTYSVSKRPLIDCDDILVLAPVSSMLFVQ